MVRLAFDEEVVVGWMAAKGSSMNPDAKAGSGQELLVLRTRTVPANSTANDGRLYGI
jgi:hypothetical protein